MSEDAHAILDMVSTLEMAPIGEYIMTRILHAKMKQQSVYTLKCSS